MLAAAGGEHDDRHRRARAQLAREVAPIAVGKHQVEQHDVGLALLERSARLGDRGGDARREALARERVREGLGDRALVLDEQDAIASGP